MTISFALSETTLIFLTISGFSSVSYYFYIFVSNFFHYIKYKEPKYTTKDKEIYLLKSQLKQLDVQKANLENQIQDLTNGIISKLQEKL
jgi:hypothetical protein